MARNAFFESNAVSEQTKLGHGNDAYAFPTCTSLNAVSAQKSPAASRVLSSSVGVRRFKCLRTKYFCAAAAAEGGCRRSRRRSSITRYLEATGNTAAIKNVDLVARVQGFLQSIDYQDGTFVKEGTTLFTIEPETYKLKLEQAQAAEAGAQASLKQAEADFKRQSNWCRGRRSSQATLDTSTSTRDNAQANLQQAQVNTKIAAVNYGYTNVTAPFDGIVTAHLVSVGELVGASSPTQLATIVALDPIYVNFNVNEQDVLRVREEARRRGMTVDDLRQLPVEVELQTETGFPHKGKLDYVSPTRQPVHRHARGARRTAQCGPRVAARLFRPRPRAVRAAAERAAGARRGARAAIRPDATCWS